MANFKVNVSDSKGKTKAFELKDKDASPLVGQMVGSELDAGIIGESGRLKVTGGSDKSGIAMRADIHGGIRKYVLLTKGTAVRKAERGERIRKLVRGNTITEDLYQINCQFDGQFVEKQKEEEAQEGKEQESSSDPSSQKEEKQS